MHGGSSVCQQTRMRMSQPRCICARKWEWGPCEYARACFFISKNYVLCVYLCMGVCKKCVRTLVCVRWCEHFYVSAFFPNVCMCGHAYLCVHVYVRACVCVVCVLCVCARAVCLCVGARAMNTISNKNWYDHHNLHASYLGPIALPSPSW